MTAHELMEIVHSGKSSHTLAEPDYSKVMFAIDCLIAEDSERGLKRFWPIIKLAEIEDKTTQEVEKELEAQRIAYLLNDVECLKQEFIDAGKFSSKLNRFYVANILGKCYENIKRLHITNVDTVRENENLTDHRRWVFAGQAMQALIASDGVMADTTQEAFLIADNMVKHGKQNSKTKCTGDGTGNTCPENNNNQQS